MIRHLHPLALLRARRPVSTSPFTPELIEVAPRQLVVDGEHVATLAVTGYPREVGAGWLDPLLSFGGRLDVSVHIDPVDPATATDRLRKRLARLESQRRHTDQQGRLPDPDVDAAVEDAHELAARVARGEGRLFRIGLGLAVYAATDTRLAEDVAAVRALAASLLIDALPASYRQLASWTSCLPLGIDALGAHRTMDTEAVSAAFPFTSPDLPPRDPTSPAAADGVLYGFNLGSSGLVHWDRFACDNHNAVILGRSGAGKSFLVKLELLRSLYRGVSGFVIDPEDEYTRLAQAVGGTVVHLGAPGVHINPFDLPVSTGPDGRRRAPADAVTRAQLFVHTALATALGEPTPAQRAILDSAITNTYQRAGILEEDPGTWHRPAPLLADLAATLRDSPDPAAAELADRLHPFVEGAFSGLLSGPTTATTAAHLTIYTLRDLPEELRPLGTLLTLHTIWGQVANPTQRRPRLVVVDEAWLLMQQAAGARFLFRLAKAARKHWCGLTVCTQDTADVLATDLGKAIIANSATQILLRQAPQAIEEITQVFGLSGGEREFLLRADRGQGLLSAGAHRVAFHATASPGEHALITTDPRELATNETPTPDAAGQIPATDDRYLDLDLDLDDESLDTQTDNGSNQYHAPAFWPFAAANGAGER